MNNIIQDVVSNFKRITRVEIKDMFDDKGMKESMVLKTIVPIRKYIKRYHKVEMTDDMLYELDEALFSK
jgi:hypothetical protein